MAETDEYEVVGQREMIGRRVSITLNVAQWLDIYGLIHEQIVDTVPSKDASVFWAINSCIAEQLSEAGVLLVNSELFSRLSGTEGGLAGIVETSRARRILGKSDT